MGFESEDPNRFEEAVVLGVDGGATSTVCVCLPLLPLCERRQLPDPLPVLGRAAAGCSNHNSLGEQAARETLEHVISEALSTAGKNHSAVLAVCLGISGVNHPSDQERILIWMRNIFPGNVKIYVKNDAVAALASGTMGKLHGCVLIAGTGCIAYGFAEDGREARAAGAGPILGDWGRLAINGVVLVSNRDDLFQLDRYPVAVFSGYGIASQALTAVVKAHDGRGPETMLTNCFLKSLDLTSPDEIIGWTYADSSWARIAALVPLVVSCAEDGDQVAHEILINAVQELALSVKTVVQRLCLAGEDGTDSFPVVLVGGVLEANKRWDIGKEVTDTILKAFPGAFPIRPEVEPAIGAALFAWTSLMKEMEANGHR
ncbi:N-acetyl-D-glucosamine kinase [Striga asiatica]|uniref:N-acetyl-D-glucosamine kinase n=1 Tax=Striga asiatica TaxID=4170 RepID=A0A5A7PVY4_STRAF|nr:N-acetyl-D-glucosamine kinase [Striga asiatica]